MTLIPSLLATTALVIQATPPPSPCRVLQPTEAQRRLEFANAVAVGSLALRTLRGESRCDLNAAGRGRCTLRDPRLVHVTFEGRHTWFELADGRSAEIEVAGRHLTCRIVG